MQNEIVLTKTFNVWNATFKGPHAASIKDLFGTDTIPTAFTSAAKQEMVVSEVKRNNPGVVVRVA